MSQKGSLADLLQKSGLFDAQWYRRKYRDVDLTSLDPLGHYIRIGYALGREPGPGATAHTIARLLASDTSSHSLVNDGASESFQGFGTVTHNPLVSVIIISHGSTKDLQALLPTLAKQSYSNVETVVVETGRAATKELCTQYLPTLKYIQCDNIGFAAANNLACEHITGEFLLLLNPDTTLDHKCIQSLIDALRFDEQAAVCCPKVYFYKEFVRLTLTADKDFSVDLNEVVSQLSYKKYFCRSGTIIASSLHSQDKRIEIDLPHSLIGNTLTLTLHSQDAKAFHICIGGSITTLSTSNSGITQATIPFNGTTFSRARFLVNNAGSGLREDGQPYDRGFAEYDDGQFFSKAYVSAFCGCCALIRRSAVLTRHLFLQEFFAYYEDSELSFWLNQKNMRMLYSPDAIVYHKHSESTGDESPLKQLLVRRSHALYQYITGQTATKQDVLSHVSAYNSIPESIAKHLHLYDRSISAATDLRLVSHRVRPTLCIYNSYYSSLGGGEKHCLDVASLAQRDYDVFLVSETDFDIDMLQHYFGIDLSACKKLISNRIDSWFTSNFDVFINSTFGSRLISKAATSYYIVSFPHTEVSEAFLASYTFLHNSEFTKAWAKRYWGEHSNTVIWPVLGFKPEAACNDATKKTKIFLSVGRFRYEGHCKNHHAIVRAFKSAVNDGVISDDWRLVIVGSYNTALIDAVDYYNDLVNEARGYNIDVLANAPRFEILNLYRSAYCYVHAAGLDVAESEPARHEHFGIAPYEGLLNGCYLLVYSIGGPADMISGDANSGFAFSSLEELVDRMVHVTNAFESAPPATTTGFEKAFSMHRQAKRRLKTLLQPKRSVALV